MLDSKKTRIYNPCLGNPFSTYDALITSGKKISWPDSVLICSHTFLCAIFLMFLLCCDKKQQKDGKS